MTNIKTNTDFGDREMDEDALQELFDDDIRVETSLDFSEDHIREHIPKVGIYESIEAEISEAVDEAALDPDEPDKEARKAEGLTQFVNMDDLFYATET